MKHPETPEFQDPVLCNARDRLTIRCAVGTERSANYERGEKGMGFEVHTREIGRVHVVEAVGKLNLTEGRTKLRDVIHVAAASGTERIVLNLARVELIDSYGIGELARTYSVVRQAGGAMKLAAANPKVLEVLAISRLNTVFEIYPDESAALQAFE